MYGLIFENFSGYIKIKYGEDAWDNVRRLSNIDSPTFSIHQVYPEQLLGKVAKKTFTTLGCNADEFFEGMGYYFVEFAAQYGYGDVLALLGRELRDFLNGLDNLHEYLKFSYPRSVVLHNLFQYFIIFIFFYSELELLPTLLITRLPRG